jgi:hypothetical protein
MRGEISIFRGAAGGMFFDVSSGSFKGSFRIGDSVCPETLVSESIEATKMKRLAEAVEDLIEWIEVVKREALNRQATCKSRTRNP